MLPYIHEYGVVALEMLKRQKVGNMKGLLHFALCTNEQFSKAWDSVSCCFSSFALAPAPLSRKPAACEWAKLEDPQLATLHQPAAAAGSHLMPLDQICHQIKFSTRSKEATAGSHLMQLDQIGH